MPVSRMWALKVTLYTIGATRQDAVVGGLDEVVDQLGGEPCSPTRGRFVAIATL